MSGGAPFDSTRRATEDTVLDPEARSAHGLPAHELCGIRRHTDYGTPSEIDRGGMGAILRARDPGIGRDVAVKVLLSGGRASEAEIAKFVGEAQVTGQLEHPNIVPVHEVAMTAAGEPFYSMKLVRGESLAAIVRRLRDGDQDWTLTRLLEVFRKTCDAIAFAHSRGVIHRDLKPANVMVGEFGEVLVMDWGLARVEGRPDQAAESVTIDTAALGTESAGRTLAGTIMGTPAYMPPEQAQGRIDRIDERSDVYSLGAILYELLCLEPPFAGTVHQVLLDVVERQPTPPSVHAPAGRVVPHELEAIAMRALAKRPRQRFRSVAALVDEISAYLEGRLVGAASYSRRELLWRWMARNRLLLTAVASALLLALGISGWRLVSHRLELTRLRGAVSALEPEARRAAANALAERPIDARFAPSIDQRRAFGEQLERLAELSDVYDALLLHAPGDAALAEQRATLLLLARLAALNEDHALALQALTRAGRLGEPVEARIAALRETRGRRAARQLEAVKRLLQRARDGLLADELDFRDAVVRIASARDEQTLALLIGELDGVRARMQDLADELLRTVAQAQTPSERTAGWQPLELTAALAAERAALHLAGEQAPALAEADRRLLAEARRRLEERARLAALGRKDTTPQPWRAQLAAAQRAALPAGHGGERYLQLLCAGLGQLGGERAARALGRYALVERSERRALAAARALALAAASDANARAVLDGLVSGDGSSRRWRRDAQAWLTARRILRARGTAADDPHADAVERAHALHLRGQHERALAELALPLRAGDAEAHKLRGAIRLRRRDWAEAAEDFRAALARQPSDLRAEADLAYALTRLRPADALARLDQAIARQPEAAILHARRGDALQRLRRSAEAIAAYRQASTLAPEAAEPWNGLGYVHLRRKTLAAAFDAFHRAAQLDPDSAEAHSGMGIARKRQKRFADAIEHFDRAIQLDPRKAVYHYHRGIAHDLAGQTDAAIADYSTAIELQPDDVEALTNRGHMFTRKGQFERALADFDAAIEIDPEHTEALHNRGASLVLLGRPREAIAAFDRALTLRPDYPLARVARAGAYVDLGDERRALADYAWLIERDPRDVKALIDRAALYFRQGRIDHAIADFDSALAVGPNARALAGRGGCYLEKGDRKRAAADLDRAIALDPREGDAYANRAVLRARGGDLKGALADLDQAIAIDPKSTTRLQNRSNIRRASGDLAGALQDALAVVRLRPRWWRAHAFVAEAHARLGQRKQAGAAIRKAIELAPQARREHLHAWARQHTD